MRNLYNEPCAFAGYPVDPADHIRNDQNHVAQLQKDPDTQVMIFVDSRPLMVLPDLSIFYLSVKEIELADHPCLFMGLRYDTGEAVFAVALDPQSAENILSDTVKAIDLRSIAYQLTAKAYAPELALLGKARSILDWHHRHGFCANCGAKTNLSKAGYARKCPACGTEHFPRTDPVVIMLVTHGDELLLGRSPHFPKGSYSALAGFMEPGETIEEACAREVFEESGIRVKNVQYLKSQPWPFPSSLMIGLTAEAENTDIQLEGSELEDARWFSRDQVIENIKQGGDDNLRIAGYNIAIARHLVEWWLRE